MRTFGRWLAWRIRISTTKTAMRTTESPSTWPDTTGFHLLCSLKKPNKHVNVLTRVNQHWTQRLQKDTKATLLCFHVQHDGHPHLDLFWPTQRKPSGLKIRAGIWPDVDVYGARFRSRIQACAGPEVSFSYLRFLSWCPTLTWWWCYREKVKGSSSLDHGSLRLDQSKRSRDQCNF